MPAARCIRTGCWCNVVYGGGRRSDDPDGYDELVSAELLFERALLHRNSGDRQLLKQLVHRLRQKIETDPANPLLLQTAAGSGYKLIVE